MELESSKENSARISNYQSIPPDDLASRLFDNAFKNISNMNCPFEGVGMPLPPQVELIEVK